MFHGMRHTHATFLLEDGVSLKVVAERLGGPEDTVVKLYGHVTPRGRAVAVGRVGTWWDDPTPGGRAAADPELAQLRATVAQQEEEIARLRAEGTRASAGREQNGSKVAELGAGGHAP